ncbi:MAG TPA: hypothetical protein VMB34_20110 [Acetobacteraceae bacterium]|nr:hypothetical protein [Acetobacteraceae bacterium]
MPRLTNTVSQRPDEHRDMHDVTYLHARASDLRSAAATSRDPGIAEALREIAGDFEDEARREAIRQIDGNNDRADSS